MALPFIPSDAGLLLVQAGVVAAPRPVSRLAWMERFRGPLWGLAPLVSIVAVVFAIRFVSDTATVLSWLAVIAVPPLAALALGWAARGSRPWAAALVVPLFVIAWRSRDSLAGEGAAALLSALSCVTLGALLAMVAPSRWLRFGIVAMACADGWLVVSDLLQAPNAVLVAAAPSGGLPRLQSAVFGTVSMGYGDLFAAGVLGAVLARAEWVRHGRAAMLVLGIAAVFDLLFLVVDELPATVPVALALIVDEGLERLRVRRAERGASRA